VSRRPFLLGLLSAIAHGAIAGAALSGCSSTPAALPPKPPLAPLSTDRLETLATSAGLSWVVRARPRKIAELPFLIPAIGRIVPEKNFDAFKLRTGLDPRQVPEVLLLRYGDALLAAEAQIVRHNVDPAELERRFFERLTADAQRAEDRPDLVRVSGIIGKSEHAFARIGRDVVVYQQRGESARGPARIASLCALGKLAKSKRLLDGGPLESLLGRFGDAPLVAAALGPFDDEWKKAARGLLEIATGVGAAARPTARENIGFAFAILADLGKSSGQASELLRAAWDDVAMSTMGHLLGLDRPIEAPIVAADESVVTLAVEVEPGRLAEGLRALAENDLDAIMRLD
jgi:hypothetical protein